ncbi:saccharopine dehydrogenase NADP-binding domain-containing protein [Halosimplex litoreum]|uniref:Saccharopine dehydrogenase NADP-binding domain-containing protein n=1 Tax=Halosimplex litoreum TaxID=1198301 RepID=A0A7T3FVJ7_9EURY|nr:saccharopine dehydrogenase NADP-binding domain-containing protein [Halosimplex litoreum]QPV61443.1 saccharopine dehydrogenase NADP-binding domain-containing protein [Halosimplex litoreum]
MADLLVYGSYGYTGRLIVEEATDRGLDVVVAGRDRNAVENQAIRRGCEERVFALDEPRLLDLALEAVEAVLNCAGPFVETADPMVEGCLRTGTDYLDITGEIEVFERLAAEDERADDEGVTVLPGVGFDVVPTDCLAAHLVERLPDADRLALGFEAAGGISPGTAKTAVRALGGSGAVRRNGRIESSSIGGETRRIDFGRGERTAMAVPWGDVSTAYRTTGVGDIAVYTAVPSWVPRAARLGSILGPLAGAGPVRSLLESLVDARVDGPDERVRREGTSHVWGEAETDDGERAVSRLVAPETYRLTKLTAAEIAERVVAGEAPTGFQTPAGAFGPDLILDIEGVERTDEPVEERS